MTDVRLRKTEDKRHVTEKNYHGKTRKSTEHLINRILRDERNIILCNSVNIRGRKFGCTPPFF